MNMYKLKALPDITHYRHTTDSKILHNSVIRTVSSQNDNWRIEKDCFGEVIAICENKPMNSVFGYVWEPLNKEG